MKAELLQMSQQEQSRSGGKRGRYPFYAYASRFGRP